MIITETQLLPFVTEAAPHITSITTITIMEVMKMKTETQLLTFVTEAVPHIPSITIMEVVMILAPTQQERVSQYILMKDQALETNYRFIHFFNLIYYRCVMFRWILCV